VLYVNENYNNNNINVTVDIDTDTEVYHICHDKSSWEKIYRLTTPRTGFTRLNVIRQVAPLCASNTANSSSLNVPG